ncbi:nuclear transport factor 2 family protein [Aquincola sp. S2]|uniref:Nuclear transport factor 2 family protein n=1 Tax=Pseudaquabacterium terrae TaxID=2732868 RepID=A0ABX2EKX9_9BURK|nr:nuclear transport factor 2 family protein [Aquabacterium terrae]NRF69306.1 nuclear transport factor 2 family protein [Aquabacterium terrae]
MRGGLALAAAAMIVAGCATPPATDTKALLVAQANAWDQAIVRKDRAAIEANMHAAFFQISPRGERSSRTEFVDSLLDAKLTIDPYTVDDLQVHLHGNTALLTATTRMSGRYDGKPFSTHYRYIDVYLREAGAWKIVSVQITPLAAR